MSSNINIIHRSPNVTVNRDKTIQKFCKNDQIRANNFLITKFAKGDFIRNISIKKDASFGKTSDKFANTCGLLFQKVQKHQIFNFVMASSVMNLGSMKKAKVTI